MNKIQEGLLCKRIPREQIKIGRAYLIYARNGNVGIAVNLHIPARECHELNYILRRTKFGKVYLDEEEDWGDISGTAIPYKEIEEEPPSDSKDWLSWLENMEKKYIDEVNKMRSEFLTH